MFDQYLVDRECSDEIVTRLQRVAGLSPDARIVAYERMIEILRFEICREESRQKRGED